MSEEKRDKSERTEKKQDEVVRIEDLTPREDVTGGRKILLGEIDGGVSDSRS
jgi:hypothetical protein